MRNAGVLASIVLLFAFQFRAQTTICLGDDETICEGDQITVEQCNVANPPDGIVFIDNLITVNLQEDEYSGIINIGFPFSFYGNDYSECLISSNGYITFDVSRAGNFSPFFINNSIPNPALPTNTIMTPWQDQDPQSNGVIGYTTLGAAPNRRFVVVFKEVAVNGTLTDACNTIVLHEASNEIETFIDRKTISTFNNGAAIHGTHNVDGTLANVVPGRNWPTQWTATLDGQLWTPDGPNNYTQVPTDYTAYVINDANTITWRDTEGNDYPNTGTELTFTPSPSNADSIGVFINYSSCATVAMITSDTSWIKINDIEISVDGSDDYCTSANGQAVAEASGGSEPYNYQWDDPANQNLDTAQNLLAGTYTVTVTDDIGCIETESVQIGDSPIDVFLSSTPVSCPGGSDGTASIEITPTPNNPIYNWSDGSNQTSRVATGLVADTFFVEILLESGCNETYEVIVEEIPEMEVTIVNQEDLTCNQVSNGLVTLSVTEGTSPYSFDWENSSSTSATATDLPADSTAVLITDAKGCEKEFFVELDEPDPLTIVDFTGDQLVCRGVSVELGIIGTGGSSQITYEWKLNTGVAVGVGDTVSYQPNQDSTIVCVNMSEACGSPSVDTCLMLTFPLNIEPQVNPSTDGECIPFDVSFENTTDSTNVAYSVWWFGNGKRDTVQGLDSTFTSYHHVNDYDVTLEITDSLGCKYRRVFEDLVSGHGYPTARFEADPNPTSIVDASVNTFNQSSSDVVLSRWFAANANPSFTFEQSPTFQYPHQIGTYPLLLVVENQHGCMDSTIQFIEVDYGFQFYAPNAFTPDDNQTNDTWRVYMEGIEVETFHLRIFNRWGELIFESRDPDGEWRGTYGENGEIAQDGTYIWTLAVKKRGGGETFNFNGHITLLR